MEFYVMTKYGWDLERGEYSHVEKKTEALTLKQVAARVARLPDSTRHFWGIDMHSDDRFPYRIGCINADEFEGEVPEFETA